MTCCINCYSFTRDFVVTLGTVGNQVVSTIGCTGCFNYIFLNWSVCGVFFRIQWVSQCCLCCTCPISHKVYIILGGTIYCTSGLNWMGNYKTSISLVNSFGALTATNGTGTCCCTSGVVVASFCPTVDNAYIVMFACCIIIILTFNIITYSTNSVCAVACFGTSWSFFGNIFPSVTKCFHYRLLNCNCATYRALFAGCQTSCCTGCIHCRNKHFRVSDFFNYFFSSADFLITYGAVNYFVVGTSCCTSCINGVFYNGSTIGVCEFFDCFSSSATFFVTYGAVNYFVVGTSCRTGWCYIVLLNGCAIGMFTSLCYCLSFRFATYGTNASFYTFRTTSRRSCFNPITKGVIVWLHWIYNFVFSFATYRTNCVCAVTIFFTSWRLCFNVSIKLMTCCRVNFLIFNVLTSFTLLMGRPTILNTSCRLCSYRF